MATLRYFSLDILEIILYLALENPLTLARQECPPTSLKTVIDTYSTHSLDFLATELILLKSLVLAFNCLPCN